MREFIIFYHVAVLGTWKDSHNIIYEHLLRSAILERCDQIIICVCGDFESARDFIGHKHNKITFVHLDSYPLSEMPTLNYIRELSQIKTFDLLYIHTKGASSHYAHGKRFNGLYTGWWSDTDKWLTFLISSCVYNFEKCLESLSHLNAIGPSYRLGPFYHFSGNFFFSKSEHTKHLRHLEYDKANYDTEDYEGRYEKGNFNNKLPRHRHEAEMWIASRPGFYHNLADINPDLDKWFVLPFPDNVVTPQE